MEINFLIIPAIRDLNTTMREIAEEKARLAAPVLRDFDLIPLVYQWFKEAMNELTPHLFIDSPTQRKKFIFIILYLYAPGVLAGDKMPQGLRQRIADAIDLKNVAFISQNLETIVFWCLRDKLFQQAVTSLFRIIEKKLRASGLINKE